MGQFNNNRDKVIKTTKDNNKNNEKDSNKDSFSKKEFD